MKWYKKYAKYYCGSICDDNCIRTRSTLFLADAEPTNETINLSWSDTDKIDFLYLRETKKGKVMTLLTDGLNTIVLRQKTEPELNMYKTIIYEPYSPSINEMLDYRDGEKVIEYFKEKGLTISK